MTPNERSVVQQMVGRLWDASRANPRDVSSLLSEAIAAGESLLAQPPALAAGAEREDALAAQPAEPVAWRSRGYGQYKTGQPGPWGYRTGAERPKLNDPSCCDVEPLYAAQGAGTNLSDEQKQLAKFYAVSTLAELVDAQAYHIEKLQAKLPQTPSLAPQRVREG